MPEDKNKRNASPVARQRVAKTAVKGVTYTASTYSSYLKAAERCHRRVGYKNNVSRFDLLVMSNCHDIYEDALNGKLDTGKGHSFQVYEPKKRIVTSTAYKDRIAQTAFVMDVFYPRVVPNMIEENYACYQNKGVEKARNKFVELLKEAEMTDEVVCADIKAFFNSIDHDALVSEMSPFLGYENIPYYRNVVNSNGDKVGLTLGSEINQLSASSLLYRFDRKAKELGKYERYMDDMRFIGSREKCLEFLNLLREFLKEIKLQLNEKKTYIQSIKRPISFLGFTFLKHESGKVTMKRKKEKVSHEKRKLRNMKNKKIPFYRVANHYEAVRACMKKGERAGVMKLDKYYKNLFEEEIKNEGLKGKQSNGSDYEEEFIPFFVSGRKNTRRNQN